MGSSRDERKQHAGTERTGGGDEHAAGGTDGQGFHSEPASGAVASSTADVHCSSTLSSAGGAQEADNLHILSYTFYVNWEAVTSPYGTVLHNAEMVQSGKFGFTTSEAGIDMVCFWLPASQTGLTLYVELDWKVGLAAKDWDAVARKDRIEGIELELLKLQDAVDSIHGTLLYMKEREKEMRSVNEYTNTRVAWYGITSLFVSLAVTGWQLWYLRSFFERKKLL
ncbi:hypothetical protein L7F22_046775 [Adiantum nelumboides]|nr:hypothetical protein [Adiantum nelumboides]